MRIVVCGTGTEVGKTHVACALVRHLGVVGLKPIETGQVRESDAERLAIAAGGEAIAPLYAFARAVSPHLAAREAGVRIDAAAIREWVQKHAAWVVETAGGLFTPLAEGLHNAALIRTLAPDAIVLVAPDRLGVLHDVTATLGAWRAESSQPLVVVLSGASHPDASTGTNAAELVRLGLAPRVVEFPRAPEASVPTKMAAAELSASLARGIC